MVTRKCVPLPSVISGTPNSPLTWAPHSLRENWRVVQWGRHCQRHSAERHCVEVESAERQCLRPASTAALCAPILPSPSSRRIITIGFLAHLWEHRICGRRLPFCGSLGTKIPEKTAARLQRQDAFELYVLWKKSQKLGITLTNQSPSP